MSEPQPPPSGPRTPEPTGPQRRLEPRITRPLAASLRQLLGPDMEALNTTVASLATIGAGQDEGDQRRVNGAREGATGLDELFTSLTNAGVLGITPRENGSTFEFITQSSESPPAGEVVLEGDDFRKFAVALNHQVATQCNPLMLVEMVANEALQEPAGSIVETTMAMNQKILSLANAGGIKMTTDEEGNTTFSLLPLLP